MKRMNKQLGVICIKVEFDVKVQSNNLPQRSGVKGEQQRPQVLSLVVLKTAAHAIQRG